jgi:membrane protease YdiL (CAAX protease family)
LEPESGESIGASGQGSEVPPGPVAAADVILRRGLLAAVLLVVLLSLFSPLDFWDVLGISAFYVLLPALALAQLPLLPHQPIDRRQIYFGSFVTIIGVGVVGFALLLRGRGEMPLLPTIPGGTGVIAWTAGLTAAGLAVIGLSLLMDRGAADERTKFLLRLLPRTGPERGMFALLSVAAGVGEEIAYRGYALWALQLLGVSSLSAAVLSSIAFGLLHVYQGPIGIIRTTLVGFVFAGGVLLSGGLIAAMSAHALVDLVAGLLLGPLLLRKWGRAGAEGDPTIPAPLDPGSPAQ